MTFRSSVPTLLIDSSCSNPLTVDSAISPPDLLSNGCSHFKHPAARGVDVAGILLFPPLAGGSSRINTKPSLHGTYVIRPEREAVSSGRRRRRLRLSKHLPDP